MLSALTMKLPHIDRLATRATFFCSGFATAAWASSIPFIKLNVQLSDGAMGLMLLCLGGGALIGMPVSGICTSRFGCKKVLIGTVSAIALLLPLLVLATSPSALAITLVLYGISIGTTGCTMNIQAISVEKAANKPLMSGFHGFYSLGGMMGAFVLTLLLTAGITPLAATGITSSLIMALLILSTPGYSTRVVSHSGPYFAMPRGPVFIIGIVCFVFFSIAMTMGRLLGDGIVARLGARVVVTLGSLIAISGFLISLSLPYWQTALLGYALIGIGCSNIVPIMFSAAGRQQVMPGPLAITAVSSLGYIGVLSGPAIVGFGAEIAGLPAALYGVALLVALALLLSKRVRLAAAA